MYRSQRNDRRVLKQLGTGGRGDVEVFAGTKFSLCPVATLERLDDVMQESVQGARHTCGQVEDGTFSANEHDFPVP